jgi:hypothetical protein
MKTETRTGEYRRVDGEFRNEHPGAGEQAGEAVGGIGGTLAGAALGAPGGPVGMILGGLAGAFGGWWAGEKAGRAAEDFDKHDDYYRGHFDEHKHPTLDYEQARVGYGLGHVAGRNPDYRGRSFDDVESDLRRGWTWRYDFDEMRPYVRTGYERTMGESSTTFETKQRSMAGR